MTDAPFATYYRHSAPAGIDHHLGEPFETPSIIRRDSSEEGAHEVSVPMNSFIRILVRRSHTVTTMCAASVAIVVFEYFNRTKFHFDEVISGLLAAMFMFITFAVCCFPDNAFVRPSTAFWRVIMGVTIMYLCLVVFCIFQDITSIRKWMQYLDHTLGVPPIEKSYAENCELFDATHPKGRLGPLIDSMDFFVLAHSFGWTGKFLIFRDWTICWICSLGFELCELTFRYILPNFWECWWDHLLLDVFGCNLLGMIGGAFLMKWLDMMPYNNWRVVNSIEDTQRPIRGIKAAFHDVETWTCWLFIIFSCLAFDVNYFFVKAILWLEPNHWMVFCRGVPLAISACHATRQCYDYMNNIHRKTIGIQLWIFLATLIAEIVFIHKNFNTLADFLPSQQMSEQPWYSKAIMGSFAGISIIGYIVSFINQCRRNRLASKEKAE